MSNQQYATIQGNLNHVQKRIHEACLRANRDPNEITLVAVSKRHPAEAMLIAIEQGIRHFGENRLEEAETKLPNVLAQLQSQSPDIISQLNWHMIGHVQSRKAKGVVPLFDMVHSVDTLKLAQRLSNFASEEGKTLAVLAEINISGETSKHGWDAQDWQMISAKQDAIEQELAQIIALPNIQLVGLMTMAPFLDEPEATRPYFRSLSQLRDTLVQSLATPLPQLSMGMTNDYEIAIEEGATMIRIGTAIFGERQY